MSAREGSAGTGDYIAGINDPRALGLHQEPIGGFTQETELELDVYTHLILESLRKDGCNEKLWRGGIIVIGCGFMQLAIACVVTLRSISYLDEFEDSITSTLLTESKSIADQRLDMEHLCGSFGYSATDVTAGYGTTYHQSRDWFASEAKCTLDMFRLVLSVEFQIVFALMVALWSMRCLHEYRIIERNWRTFCLFDNDASDLAEYSSLPQGDQGNSSTISVDVDERKIPISSQATLEPGRDVGNVHIDDEGGVNVRKLTKPVRAISLGIQVLRMFVCVIMFFSGIALLTTTTRFMDLILNALAMEFVFHVDELFVDSLIDSRDEQRLQKLKPIVYKLFNSFPWNVLSPGHRPYAAWTRLVGVTLLVAMVTYTQNMLYYSFASRAGALCLTEGLTDGSDMALLRRSDLVPAVVFPYYGMCSTLVEMVGRIEEPLGCTAMRSEFSKVDPTNMQTQAPTRGECSPVTIPDIGSWDYETTIDRDIVKTCVDMWFGNGVPLGDHIPALFDYRSEEHGAAVRPGPRMFGCRREDLRTVAHLPANPYIQALSQFIPLYRVTVECQVPAFGHSSAAWKSGALDSGTFVPPKFFFQYAPKAPIERQVGACDALKSKMQCNQDPCRVLADVSGGKTCANYCGESGLVCQSAAEEYGNSCKVKEHWQCDKPFDSSDLICQCALPPKDRVCGKLEGVLQRCGDGPNGGSDPCSALLNVFEFAGEPLVKHKNCKEYCSTAGLKCVSHYETKPWTCKLTMELSCDSLLTWDKPDRVCQCGAAEEPEEKDSAQVPTQSNQTQIVKDSAQKDSNSTGLKHKEKDSAQKS